MVFFCEKSCVETDVTNRMTFQNIRERLDSRVNDVAFLIRMEVCVEHVRGVYGVHGQLAADQELWTDVVQVNAIYLAMVAFIFQGACGLRLQLWRS
jgi:hypothetical protein